MSTSINSAIVKPISEGFQGIKDIGMGIGGTVKELAEYFESAGKFVGSTSVNIFEFIKEFMKDLIRLIPSIIDLLKSSMILLKYGVESSFILLLLAPIFALLYYTSYLIQILEDKY
jgi:hypothetical protein